MENKRGNIRILSWNINCLPRIATVVARKPHDRVLGILNHLSRMQANIDIIVLQEVFRPDVRELLQKRLLDWQLCTINHPRCAFYEYGSGLFVAYRRSVVEHISAEFYKFPLPSRAMEDLFVRKGVLVVKCGINNNNMLATDRFVLLATHMQAYDYKWCKYARSKQLGLLKDISRQYNDYHRIIVGDFNIDAYNQQNPEYMHMLDILNAQDCIPSDKNKISSISHPDKSKKAANKRRPDGILFVSSSQNKAQVSTQGEILDYREYTDKFLTDHLPVHANIKFS